MGSILNNDGQLILFPGQKIANKTTEGKVEKYVIETHPQIYGGLYGGLGAPGQAPYKTEISLLRDEDGRVVKVISGEEKLGKKEIESREKASLQMQIRSILMTGGMASPYEGSAFGTLPGTEPLYQVKDKEGKFSYKKLSELDKEERSQVGLSEDLHKEITQKWRKDKKSIAKIEKGIKNFQVKSKPAIWLGTEAEFDIKDGVCTPKVVSSRFFNSADGSVGKTPIFTKEACEEVSKLYLKHKDKITKCDESNEEVSADLWQRIDKIKEIRPHGMYLNGMEMGRYMSFLFDGRPSHLSTLKSACDKMVGEFKFGMGIGTGTKTNPSSATPQ
jgi:hypothetical protein